MSLAAQSADALTQLSRAVRYVVKANVPGDFVECGVYRGAAAVAMIRTLQALKVTDRKIRLYDTFEGFPEPEEIDQHYKRTQTEDGGLKSWALHKRDDGSAGSNWCYCPIDQVKRVVAGTGYPQENITFVKGLVEDTIPSQAPEQIALLRLDTDFYRSTKHELNYMYPLVPSGGVLIIDDYGSYRGSRQAVDEYFAEHELHVHLIARG
jgi:O-methyltransferase